MRTEGEIKDMLTLCEKLLAKEYLKDNGCNSDQANIYAGQINGLRWVLETYTKKKVKRK